MQKSHLEANRSKRNPLKRLNDSSRREVLFDSPSRKKQKSESPVKSRSSSVSILSSRPNSNQSQDGVDKKGPSFASVDPSKFYENPKSLLERQYERNLLKHVPLEAGEGFVPLESEPQPEQNSAELTSDPNYFASMPEVAAESQQDSKPISFTDEEVMDMLSEPSQDSDLSVGLLLRAADLYVKKAHQLVLGCNTVSGTQVYCTYIKQALRLLHFCIHEFNASLNPSSKSALFQKLGVLYFEETEEIDRAEEYINLALSIATRHDLTTLKLACELWHCRVLESMGTNSSSSVYSEKISYYSERGQSKEAEVFSLAQACSSTLTDSVVAVTQPHDSAKESVPLITLLELINKTVRSLHRGSPTDAKTHINACRSIIVVNKFPPQLHALVRLLNLLYYVHTNDQEKGRAHIMKISESISLQRKARWPHWRQDGSILISVPVNNSSTDHVPLQIQWLDPNEFIIVFYFLSGLLFVLDPAQTRKADKAFGSCLESLTEKLQELTDMNAKEKQFAKHSLTEKIICLNFIRYSVIYYKIWMSFMHQNDFKGIQQVENFLKCFEDYSFTKEEVSCYKALIPKFLYLVGLYHQSHGDMIAAKYYFAVVRLKLSNHQLLSPDVQQVPRIGFEIFNSRYEFNELILFSTLHLVIVTESELLSNRHPNDGLKPNAQAKLHEALHSYYNELASALSGKSHKAKPAADSNKLLQLCYKIVLSTMASRNFSSEQKQLHSEQASDMNRLRKASRTSGFLKSLSSFVISKLSANMEESTRHLRSAVANLREAEATSQNLGAFINATLNGKHYLEPDVATKLHTKFGSHNERAKAALDLASFSFQC